MENQTKNTRNRPHYKTELQVCREDCTLWKGIAIGVTIFACVAVFLLAAALKGIHADHACNVTTIVPSK